LPGIDVNAELGEAVWARADKEGVLRVLQRARLDQMVLSSRRALAGDLVAGNAEVRGLVDEQAALYGWVVVNPTDLETSGQELRRHAGAAKIVGLRLDTRAMPGVLESEAAAELINGYRRYSKPALVTVCSARDVVALEQLARQVPTVKFIAAGAGGDAWQACASMAKRVVNVLLEPFSGGCQRGKLEGMVATVAAHRILFATGIPDQNPGAALGLLADAQITEGEKQSILTANARRLFGME